MKNCDKCGINMLSMVLSSNENSETLSWRCPSCGDVLIDMREKEPEPPATEAIEREEPKKKAKDKHVKVHEEVWTMASEFVRTNRIMYPSIKFFTQQAIMEKIKREGGEGQFQ